ncbi:competence type IV pilus ATPase ComGA [Streptococcus ictaluri]|uniref:Type II/IV secretion system protein n=1 Tax=Streptococcus ictaluri 707-05 TaxID=764299 RepID=G5K4K7_9STRE|nr:competence type IV pilus ATPase ComGA [Streptococcus ictaluri]EHI68821.1 type II/IV secretion system protein [Streptococcus ictaluri 707-05]
MVQDLAKAIITQALALGAQDIYILPNIDGYYLWARVGSERKALDVDGCHRVANLISHFKYVAGMSVGEKRRCQLGACDYQLDKQKAVSLRLTTVGDYRGQESLVIRLLHDGQKELNYWFDDFSSLKEVIRGARGLYLFSGPVGSGKATLMHQLISETFQELQVISIEDPVEIKDERILQLQVNDSIGMTYDNLIKLSLRHRPDLLIIGEIRDQETARAAIRASMTGAIVFSTVHAKSIPGVYGRLLELGISQAELENSLNLIAYQRFISGGALIDYSQRDFEKHSPRKWNQKIDQLFNSGHLTEQEARIEKIIA